MQQDIGTAPILVRSLEDGDFEVVRGGDICRRWNGNLHPGSVKAGENVSAAEICEWQEAGAKIETVS